MRSQAMRSPSKSSVMGAIMPRPRPRPSANAPCERRAPPSPHRSSRWGEGRGEGQVPAPTVRPIVSLRRRATPQRPHVPLPLTLPSPHGVKNAAGRGDARTPQEPRRGAVGWANRRRPGHSEPPCQTILPTLRGTQPHKRERNSFAGRSAGRAGRDRESRSGAPPLGRCARGNTFPVEIFRHGAIMPSPTRW